MVDPPSTSLLILRGCLQITAPLWDWDYNLHFKIHVAWMPLMHEFARWLVNRLVPGNLQFLYIRPNDHLSLSPDFSILTQAIVVLYEIFCCKLSGLRNSVAYIISESDGIWVQCLILINPGIWEWSADAQARSDGIMVWQSIQVRSASIMGIGFLCTNTADAHIGFTTLKRSATDEFFSSSALRCWNLLYHITKSF